MHIREFWAILLVVTILTSLGCSSKEEGTAIQKQKKRHQQSVLSPPEIRLLFSAKSKIRHLNSEDRLAFFSQQGGHWLTKKVDGDWVTIGASPDSSAILLSKQKLTNKGKSFVFDFKLANYSRPCGLIYGEHVLLIAENTISLNKINIETRLPHEAIHYEETTTLGSLRDEWNSFAIVTGYGINSTQLRTTLYVNGQGIHLPIGNNSGCFGVYLASNNEICIKDFRWQRGK